MIVEVGFEYPKRPFFFYDKMPELNRLRIHFYKNEKRIALKIHRLINLSIVLDGYRSNTVNYEVLRKVFS